MDTIAGRALQIGGTVEGMARVVAAKSSLPEYPMTITTGRDHVAALAIFGNSARQAISQSDEFDDADTADVFREVSRGIDRAAKSNSGPDVIYLLRSSPGCRAIDRRPPAHSRIRRRT